MATIKENINKPDYKLLSGLVQGTEDELKDWSKKETRTLNADVGPFVTRAAFTKYENELAELVRQIREGRDFYLTEKETWHDAPVTWTTDYPSQHKAYREKVYALKVQYAKLIAEQNHLKEVKAEKERAARRTSRPTPTTPTAKKSGWWKHALAYGILGTGLVTALFSRDKNKSQSGPHEGDKSAVRMEQRMDALEKRLASGSTGNVVQRGNTFVAETAQQTGRRVIAEAMNPDSNPIPADVHQGRITRQAQQLAEARYNTANAREAALTTGYMRQANDNVLGMTRDEAYTGAYVSGENLQTAKNLRAISDETSPLTSLTDTLRRGTGAFDAGSDLVKSARHFRDSIRGHRGHQ